MTTREADPDQGDHDFGWPESAQRFIEGERLLTMTKPGDFIRACFSVAASHSYVLITEDPRSKSGTLLDAFTAGAVSQVYKACSFSNKRKLVKILRARGPAAISNLCFKMFR